MTLKVVMALAYTVAVPAVVGAFCLTKKERNSSITILSWLFISAFAFELLATAARVLFKNNLLVLNLASVVEGCILLFFIHNLLNTRIQLRYLNLFIIGAYAIIAIAILEFIFKGIDFFNISYTVKNLLLITGFLLALYEVAKGYNISRWLYITIGGFVFYFVANFIFFLLVPSMKKDLLMFFYDTHNIINALINVFFGYTLWKQSATKSSFSHLLY